LSGVIPGEKFYVYGRKNDRFLTSPERDHRFAVKAGELVDLGRIVVKED
jgi:hypothetical protein